MGFPGGSEGKASAYNAGDAGSIPGLGRSPGRREWQPNPVLLPGKSYGLRSLVGYSPWGCKELDMAEQLHFSQVINQGLYVRFSNHKPFVLLQIRNDCIEFLIF